MGKWSDRLAELEPAQEKVSAHPFEGTDKTDKRGPLSIRVGLLSVLAVGSEGGGAEIRCAEAGADCAPSAKEATTPVRAPARDGSVRAHAREVPAELYAPAREAMHRLGHVDGDAEDQLEVVLQTVAGETVAADLQAIGDERGLPPNVDAVQEMHTKRLKRRGLPPAVIASLAPRLAQRDRDCVDLRSCAECARFERIPSSRVAAWHCQHPSTLIKHGCHGPDVLFRCEGFRGCR